ncbi:Crp/Fnr family transcriptional regulator [Gottfriedia acidiceleris]|uniref:Crp/Fnr family transcriptional regulator n=1 Tax=Gottfriedia acidiceleris TaxID=371036 RepID=UPI002F26556A
MKKEQIEMINNKFPFFREIPIHEWNDSSGFITTLPVREMIEEGYIFKHVSFVLSGCIRIYKISPSGKELTLYRLRSGDTCVIMLASVLGETGYEAIAEIEKETELFVLPAQLFREWTYRYKEINTYIHRLFLKRLKTVANLIEDITFKPLNSRLADLLLQKSSGTSDNFLYITHQSLSIDLGTAREVVSRTLKDFERNGWIQQKRDKIFILQKEKLKDLVEEM